MTNLFERRQFLQLSAGTLAASLLLHGEAPVNLPEELDHILLGSADLQGGIAFVEQHTGVRATLGGVHPGRGTRNALLSLGERRYLEIIAPDSSQGPVVHFPQILGMTEPRLIGWAVHPPDIAATAKLLREIQIAFTGPDDGSRQRPDGHVLNWKTINLADDRHGLLPFFIEW